MVMLMLFIKKNVMQYIYTSRFIIMMIMILLQIDGVGQIYLVLLKTFLYF